MNNPVGFWRRFAAVLLDSLLIVAVIFIFALIVFGEFAAEEFTLQLFETGLTIIYLFILPPLWYGYTVGKRLLGIRIVKVDGSNVSFGTMLLRHFLGGIVYVITLLMGVLVSAFMIGLRKDRRALHDFIANTYVTTDKP
ncbi:RDD family protein [Salsuginibacillus kocurii]|uniref:RDD family protein n=1 Tax=Salsuginibacillus kocurii TaxID=427078 RepID=UPI00035C899E